MIAVVSMIFYISIVKWITPFSWYESRLFLLIYVVFIVISASFIYLIVLARGNALTSEQMAALPFSWLFVKNE